MARKRELPETVAPDHESIEDSRVRAYLEEQRAIEQAAIGDIAVLGDPSFDEVAFWSIWRYRTDDEVRRDPSGDRLASVGRLPSGPIETDDFRRHFGGGSFVLRGYVDRIDEAGRKRGSSVKHTIKLTVEGPRKDFSKPEPPPPAVAAAVTNSVASDPLLRLLERMSDQLTRLEAAKSSGGGMTEMIQSLVALDALRGRGTPPVTGIGELVAALQGLHSMAPKPAAAVVEDPVAMAKMMLDVLRDGVAIGQVREPVQVTGEGDGPSYLPLVEKALEVFGNLLSRRGPSPLRPRPPGAPPAPPDGPPPAPGSPGAPTPPFPPPPEPERSSAVVVDEPPPPAPSPMPAEYRWTTAVEALYRAMIQATHPGDFAASLEHILSAEELDMMTGATTDQVLGYLSPIIASYPDLKEPRGRAYIDAVLAELRGEGEDDAE